MSQEYVLTVKTGEAEFLALNNSKQTVIQRITPLIELTRGRKRPKIDSYQFESNLEKMKEIFKGNEVYLDLTSDDSLMCDEIVRLYESTSGYSNWVNFLIEQRNEKVFKKIIPVILTSGDDPNIEMNLKTQVTNLLKGFDRLAYRSDIDDEFCYEDLPVIYSVRKDVRLDFVIDCKFVPVSGYQPFVDKVVSRVRNIKSICKDSNWLEPKFILSSTSFPNIVQNYGNDDSDEFPLVEQKLIENVRQQLPLTNIVYSDYGSINPIRNDYPFVRGWVPRIDVPFEKGTYYYRERRPKGVTAYSSIYSKIAKFAINDSRCPNMIDNWGIKQIEIAALGAAPGSSPRFWIAVRMNIYLEMQLYRLQKEK